MKTQIKRLGALALTAILALSASISSFNLIDSTRVNASFGKVGYFAPISVMRLVEKGNRGTIDPDLSYASERLLDSALTLKKAEYGIDKLLTPADTVLLDKVEAEIKHLAFTSRDMHVLNGLVLPPTIDSLMEASGNRYAVAMVGSGYSRTRLNFSNKQRIRVAKEIVFQGKTFGAKYPEKAVSIVHALLLDSKENKVVYYRQNRMPEREPTNANIVTTQVNSLLVGLFMNN